MEQIENISQQNVQNENYFEESENSMLSIFYKKRNIIKGQTASKKLFSYLSPDIFKKNNLSNLPTKFEKDRLNYSFQQKTTSTNPPSQLLAVDKISNSQGSNIATNSSSKLIQKNVQKLKYGHFMRYQPITSIYRPFKIIHRYKCKQFFLLQQISQPKNKVIMKVNCKTSFKDQKLVKGISELQNLAKINHPNIVRMVNVFQNFNKYMVILQFFEGISLVDFILQYTITEETGKLIIKQILLAIQHMHQNDIIHRDIRAQHIFIIDYQPDISKIKVKIVDLSLSIYRTKLRRTKNNIFGSIYYAPPESAQGYIYKKYDIWSIGILTLIIFSRFHSSTIDDEEYLKAILTKNQLYYQHIKNVPQNVMRFINYLLAQNHKRRPSASEALNHCWLASEAKRPKRKDIRRASKQLFTNNSNQIGCSDFQL